VHREPSGWVRLRTALHVEMDRVRCVRGAVSDPAGRAFDVDSILIASDKLCATLKILENRRREAHSNDEGCGEDRNNCEQPPPLTLN